MLHNTVGDWGGTNPGVFTLRNDVSCLGAVIEVGDATTAIAEQDGPRVLARRRYSLDGLR